MTLRARMALALAALAGLAALLVGVATYLAVEQSVRSEVDRTLRDQVQALGSQPGEVAELCGVETLRRRPGLDLRGGLERVGGVVAQCLDDDGQPVAFSSPVELPVDDDDVDLATAGGAARIRTVTVDDTTYRVQTVPIAGTEVGAIQVARDFSESQRVLDALRVWIVAVVLVVAAAGALAGWLIARRATRPLVQLTDAAEEVAGTGRLDVEVPPAGRDEPGRLARAFSSMLAALRQSREQQHQLVQDAGHELRTPLTSLRTNVETLRRHPDLPPATTQAILSDLDTETRELGSLVDELVQLATDTYDDESEQSVALDQVVHRVAERARRRSGREVVVVARPTTVVGRPRDLARAVGNLVDNATKFSEAPSPVEIDVGDGRVVVRDHGPGVPSADLDHVFQRFYRSPAARSTPGSGLGLSIVDQTARAHGGTVSVANHPDGGAVFTLALPPAGVPEDRPTRPPPDPPSPPER